MSYTSLRKLYEPLVVVPPDLRELYEKIKPGYARMLLGLLLQSPARVEVGIYRWQTGRVYLPTGSPFAVSPNGGTAGTATIEYATLWKTVICLGRTLVYHGSPYGLWKSSEAGHGEPRRGRLGGYRYTRNHVPFAVGLVDRRRHLNGAAGGG